MVGPWWGGHKRVLFSASATVILYAGMARAVTGPADTPLFLLGYVVAWALYLWALSARTLPRPPLLLAWALVARLLWVGSEPWLSDDLYRYLLDGRVLAAGVNPFRHAPEHALIQGLLPELSARVNHPHVPTIYPAVVQLVAYLAALLRLGVDGWRILISLVDVALVYAIARLFGGGERGWRAAAVYALCPLAIVESGANGHIEALVLLFLALALQSGRRGWLSALFLGLATLVKYFPLLLLPLWLERRGGWRIAFIVLAIVTGGMLPFALGGVDFTVGLRSYLEHWSFNGPIYAALASLLGEASWLRLLPFVVVVAASLPLRRRMDILSSLAPLLFVFLLFGPTLHPWYALWILPWLGARPNWALWAFVGSMGLSYAVWWQQHLHGQWSLPFAQSLGIWSLVPAAWLAQRLLRARSS